ncbi:hypothetical protein HYG86_11575 [Alkalicella caledoniensis]|uniref:SnoaL-like domain-containing protein n=1 Tax=Alkalicella caledoniensis TaxID=2731377 RepID=A0A7G9W9J3_ALKCA|nr:hypothetical protein [Alkalicella caledoniensis]QNO15355.1 hypothetical protein HYG86_11575 [Alkalicella caledoniensis]
MKTEVMFHCGNAPKMERVIELTIALAKKDVNLVKSHVREDFVWKTVGEDDVILFEDLTQKLARRPTVTKLNVENALSHGNGAMCEGTLSFEDGSLLYFCNVVKFVNTAKDALVKEAHTYFVK